MTDKLREEAVIKKLRDTYKPMRHQRGSYLSRKLSENNYSINEVLELVPYLLDTLERYKREIERLKQGICEHADRDELGGDCELCDLAVAKEGYAHWFEKAKEKDRQIKVLVEALEKIEKLPMCQAVDGKDKMPVYEYHLVYKMREIAYTALKSVKGKPKKEVEDARP